MKNQTAPGLQDSAPSTHERPAHVPCDAPPTFPVTSRRSPCCALAALPSKRPFPSLLGSKFQIQLNLVVFRTGAGEDVKTCDSVLRKRAQNPSWKFPPNPLITAAPNLI